MKIITISLCPAWDVTCIGSGLKWQSHQKVDSCTAVPAGKALNVSKALAWMKKKNTVAGLWGQPDYDAMRLKLDSASRYLDFQLTTVPVSTRQNVTIVDIAASREMHLRSPSELASKIAISRLSRDLKGLIQSDDICVFAGSLPAPPLLDDAISIIRKCVQLGGKVVLDTSGEALKKVVDESRLWLIKPNIEELGELVAMAVPNRESSIIKAASSLLGKADNILVSRGKDGVILVTSDGAWSAKAVSAKTAPLSTVGCGDFLLGGFLNGYKENKGYEVPLRDAVVAATARAFQLTTRSWAECKRNIEVEIKCIESFAL